MVFSKKWLRNHPKFLLHFLIHIDVLMLCKKFELMPLYCIFTLIYTYLSFFRETQNCPQSDSKTNHYPPIRRTLLCPSQPHTTP